MKKFFILLFSFALGLQAMAQNSERTSAFMFNRNGQYDKARESIDKAIQHEKTKNDPKTWMYRGIIYLNIVFSEQFAGLDPQALEKSLESFKKVIELDPTDKNKQMAEIKPRIDVIGQQYFSIGVSAFNESDYKTAAVDFAKAFDVAKIINKVDTLALINAGLSSLRAEDYESALNYYEQLKNIGFDEPELYRNVAAAYRGLENTEKMFETIRAGRAKYPNDSGLLLEQINAYLSIGEGERVVNDLQELLKYDPQNYSIYFVLGTLYGDDTKADMYNMTEAANYYKKAIEIEPNYYDAIYNLGALYINEANKIQVKANDLPLDKVKEYEALTKEADEIIRLALPYLEKANQLQPGNPETISVLKSVYIRFKMDEKLKELNQQ
jgi:tetratricopeptide (TPR) repeat protein